MAGAPGEAMPAEIAPVVAEVDESLTNLESTLDAYLALSAGEMSQRDAAKKDLATAYSAVSLLWMYMSSKGVNLSEHPIKNELQRIRRYMATMKELESGEKAAAGVPPASQTLNKAAAERFIQAALSDGGKQGDAKQSDTASQASDGSRGKKKESKKRKQPR